MASSALTHGLRTSSFMSFLFGVALLFFALFEVFDIDGSSVPTSTASTVLEARQSSEIKPSCPRAIAVAMLPVVQPSQSEIGALAAARECPRKEPVHRGDRVWDVPFRTHWERLAG